MLLIGFAIVDFVSSWMGVNLTPFFGPLSQFSAMIIGFIGNDNKGVPEDESPQRVKRLFKYFLKQVRERQPNVPFLWIEITPTQSRWAQWEDIQKVNKKIKA